MSFDIKSGPVFSALRIDPVPGYEGRVSILRLDAVHPVISGNKWYKLKGYLHQGRQEGKTTVVTFGGAYSNHIVATAAACQQAGLKAHGIIRGEVPKALSPTLQDAMTFGMELHFTSRAAYQQKQIPESLRDIVETGSCLLIGEGGYGLQGAAGIEIMAREMGLGQYAHLLCAVGTGTTLAGLARAATQQQKVTGLPVLKNGETLQPAIEALLSQDKRPNFSLINAFHFGGYARSRPWLFHFMNHWYATTGIPSDFVYTGKLFFGFDQLWQEGFFETDASILLVHTGGLQGNRSLPPGTLIF